MIAKVLRDLGRLGNRETPVVLSVLVIEDLAMAFYLPILSALVIGAETLQGATAVVIAVSVVVVILYIALRHGRLLSRAFTSHTTPSRCCWACSGSPCSSPGSPSRGERVSRRRGVPRRDSAVRSSGTQAAAVLAAARPVRDGVLRLLRHLH